MIENSSDITTLLDAGGTILYESPSVERLLGHIPGDLIGTPLLKYVHPDDSAIVLAAIEQSAGNVVEPFEFRCQGRDGGWRTLEATMNRLLDNPDIGGIVLNCRDITARKQDEATIKHLAYFDALTGLPNRSLFNDRLAQGLAHSRRRGRAASASCSSISTDSKRSTRLSVTAPAISCFAPPRTGSAAPSAKKTPWPASAETSFSSCFPDVDAVDDAARIAEQDPRRFSPRPSTSCGHELHVTTSIGVSLFPPDGTDAETLSGTPTRRCTARRAGRRSLSAVRTGDERARFQAAGAREQPSPRPRAKGVELYYQPLVAMRKAPTSAWRA